MLCYKIFNSQIHKNTDAISAYDITLLSDETNDKNSFEMVDRKEENHATSSICPWFQAKAAQLMTNFIEQGTITLWI